MRFDFDAGRQNADANQSRTPVGADEISNPPVLCCFVLPYMPSCTLHSPSYMCISVVSYSSMPVGLASIRCRTLGEAGGRVFAMRKRCEVVGGRVSAMRKRCEVVDEGGLRNLLLSM
jgi:hypothetical protein